MKLSWSSRRALRGLIADMKADYHYRLYMKFLHGDGAGTQEQSAPGRRTDRAPRPGTGAQTAEGSALNLDELERAADAAKARFHYRLYLDSLNADGGPGSGNFGHAGRKGMRGGSLPGTGGGKTRDIKSLETVKRETPGIGAASDRKKGRIIKEAPETRRTSMGTFGGSTPAELISTLTDAKESRPEQDRFRVTCPTEDEFVKEHPGAVCHVTPGGSTCAVALDGDIVSVCKKRGDRSVTGGDLLKMAVEAGGVKLDSYDGNHEFYNAHGFTPVSWCHWADEAAGEHWLNPDWREANGLPEDITTEQLRAIPDSQLKVPREDVVFYRYTGDSTEQISLEDFKKQVPASRGYDEAKKRRDDSFGHRKPDSYPEENASRSGKETGPGLENGRGVPDMNRFGGKSRKDRRDGDTPSLEEYTEAVVRSLTPQWPDMSEQEIRDLLAEKKNTETVSEFYQRALKRIEDGTGTAEQMLDYGAGLAANYFFMEY